ncbi:hypothetical protein WS70_03700 [Burkholderia mayonis]|uniref:Uncharacterized protein n=1 Tax=Burkholderia mayonis TaxID=1385591 RepID=A0A1B4FBI6_9BURK|nr:hypothetical protein WS70_03700 [Burkholderia mayonis]KVE49894.1 hypothetical protein WS70_19135 [Burkholderia mayonis]
MRNDDECSIFAFFEQFIDTFLMESGIADRNNFINQVTIKFDGERKCEREARLHAAGICLDWLAKIFAKLCKFLYKFTN